jgi:anthranilate/para-aminobenzoate synthase component II
MVDCGMKNNIIRCLLKHDITVTLVPWDYDFRGADYDGLFISNGPGNPALLTPVIEHLKYALQEDRPIMGICLGHQLMALAAGAQTFKMKYGHRGHNQPVIVPGTQKCFITSQNHGFAVDPSTLPSDWEAMFTNLNDILSRKDTHGVGLRIPPLESGIGKGNADGFHGSSGNINALKGSKGSDGAIGISYLINIYKYRFRAVAFRLVAD